MENKRSWKIDKEKRVDELKEWLDCQIALREELIEESEFDSGIHAPCLMYTNLMGDIKKSMEITGVKHIARILGCEDEVKTVNNPETSGIMYTLMYGDCMLYDRGTDGHIS